MAEDITWTIIGPTPLPGIFRGREEVTAKLFAGLRAAPGRPAGAVSRPDPVRPAG
jgi:hypothetical protein